MIAEQLEQMLRKSSHTVAFTGAGISTLSGIRDFRGKNGVYLEPWHGRPVEEILSLDCFLREPELFYGWAAEFLYRLDEFQPAAVHRALALLEQKGLLASIYTQNIDLLHQKAGSSRVYELHGSPARHHCLSKKSFPSTAFCGNRNSSTAGRPNFSTGSMSSSRRRSTGRWRCWNRKGCWRRSTPRTSTCSTRKRAVPGSTNCTAVRPATTASAAAGSSPTGRSHRRCWPEKCRTAPRAES